MPHITHSPNILISLFFPQQGASNANVKSSEYICARKKLKITWKEFTISDSVKTFLRGVYPPPPTQLKISPPSVGIK